LFADEIASLEAKIANLEAEAKAEIQVIETAADNFYNKYHAEIWIIATLLILHVAGKFGF
jgi:restriction endonuclease S subunit